MHNIVRTTGLPLLPRTPGRYRLTAAAPDNTRTLYDSRASTTIEVEYLIGNMRRFSPSLVVTIEDTWTGIVETRRGGRP